MKNRKNNRDYNKYQINNKQLSSLFPCFAETEDYRLISSAVVKYPIEVYALCFNVKNLNNKVVYHNYNDNSLSIVCDCKSWDDLKLIMGVMDLITGEPSIMFVFVGFSDKIISKYGERGGRFF